MRGSRKLQSYLSDFVWTSYGNSPYLIVALHEDRRLYVLLWRLYNLASILGHKVYNVLMTVNGLSFSDDTGQSC